MMSKSKTKPEESKNRKMHTGVFRRHISQALAQSIAGMAIIKMILLRHSTTTSLQNGLQTGLQKSITSLRTGLQIGLQNNFKGVDEL